MFVLRTRIYLFFNAEWPLAKEVRTRKITFEFIRIALLLSLLIVLIAECVADLNVTMRYRLLDIGCIINVSNDRFSGSRAAVAAAV